MTDKTDSKERANFEAHMRKLNACTRLERQSEAVGGNYRTISVQRAWELWQAARASLAASAGSEPVAYAMFADNGNIRLWSKAWIPHPDAKPLYLHPSPPEGMVGGWMPIETAPKYTEHGVSQHLLLGYAPDEIHEDGFVSQGYWMEAEEDAPDNMGHDGGWVDVHFDFFRCGRSFGAEAYRSAGTQPTHWMPLPPPPTTSAGSGKGD